MSLDMNNLKQRTASGLSLALLVLSFLYVGGGPTTVGSYDLGDGRLWSPYVFGVLVAGSSISRLPNSRISPKRKDFPFLGFEVSWWVF